MVSGSVGGLDNFDRLSMMYKLKEIRVIRVTKAKHCASVVQLSRRHFNAKVLENTVSGTETDNSSGSPEFNPFFTRVRVVQSLVFYVVCFQLLFVSVIFFCTLYYQPSSNYDFWLSLPIFFPTLNIFILQLVNPLTV